MDGVRNNLTQIPPRNGQILAVDFDGTLCKFAFPKIGEPNHALIENLIKLQLEDGAKIILWTCRGGAFLEEAVEWCKAQGLVLHAVNDDLPEIKDSEFGRNKSKKVFAHRYIDDAAMQVVA